MNSDSESVGTSESLFQTSGRNVSGSVEKDGEVCEFLPESASSASDTKRVYKFSNTSESRSQLDGR